MINLTTIRKDNAVKTSDLLKQKKEHEKRIRDHEKRLNDLKEILEKSQQKAIDLKAKIETAIIEGNGVDSLKETLHSEQLDVSAYEGAITALGYAMQRESDLLGKVNEGISALEKDELKCKLIETVRVYNRQAAELARTISQLDIIADSMGGYDKTLMVHTGDSSLIALMHLFTRIPKVFIKESEGENLPENKRTSESFQHFWNVERDSVQAKKRLGTFQHIKGELNE